MYICVTLFPSTKGTDYLGLIPVLLQFWFLKSLICLFIFQEVSSCSYLGMNKDSWSFLCLVPIFDFKKSQSLLFVNFFGLGLITEYWSQPSLFWNVHLHFLTFLLIIIWGGGLCRHAKSHNHTTLGRRNIFKLLLNLQKQSAWILWMTTFLQGWLWKNFSLSPYVAKVLVSQ